MFSKKSKEITVENLIEIGFPTIFATMLHKRIVELMKHKTLNGFNPEDFNPLVKFTSDREKLAKTLNREFYGQN